RLGGRPDVAMIMNGSLAGLVGITASAHIMTPLAAAGIGSIAAVVMYAVAKLLERLEIDDVVGAVPVHLAAGIWGTLAVAIFGDPASWGTGLGRWDQFVVQATGVGATFAWTFGVGFTLLWLMNRWYPLRIGPEGERLGLNVAEHGASTEILDLLTEMAHQRQASDFSQPVTVEPHTEVGQIAQQYNRVLADINAEQRKREAATEALRQNTVSLQLLRETAAAANQAKNFENAIHSCLDDICAFGGWSVGHCYMVDDATGKLVSAKIWHLDDAERFSIFREVTENTKFESGVGLPGRVMASGEPAWIVDVTEDENFTRAKPAEDIGLKGGFAFPVLVREDVAAVLEFFSLEPVEPDETVVEIMALVGTQLGRVIERSRSEAARFKSVVDNMPAHVHLRDRDGRFILINRKYEEFYGVTNDSVRGKTLQEVEADAEFDIALDENVARDREVIERNCIVEHEYTVKRHGKLHTVTDVKFPIRDASGEITAIGGVELDITKLKQAEEALRASEQRLHGAVDSLQGGFALYDAEDRLVLVNDQYAQINPSVAEILERGGTYEDVLRANVARGMIAEAVGREEEFLRERLARHRNPPAEPIVRNHTNGRSYLLREVKTPEGGIVLTYSEITELKRAEAALSDQLKFTEALVVTIPNLIWAKDTKGRYVNANEAFLDAFDLRREDCIGKTVMDMKHLPLALRKQRQKEETALLRTGGSYHTETTRRFADGKEHDVLYWEKAFELSDGVIGGLVGVMVDISEQKNLERELAKSKARMQDELNIGREIQMSMVPRTFPAFPDRVEFDVYATLEPAREVGGDFYDFFFIDEERLCFGIGDVSGKGVPAALFMAMSKTLIKSRAVDDRSTASILTHVNDELSADNKSTMFVTVFAAILNIRTGELVYTNAGH
ncbi:MAG: PAS domain S-box protein, partial [Chloroflexi bacterium]|nr:PAS domain S-box protein [Chloroflexota bacterium]